MNAALVYIHALEGRLRIKVPEVRGAPAAASEIEGKLRGLPAVDETDGRKRVAHGRHFVCRQDLADYELHGAYCLE